MRNRAHLPDVARVLKSFAIGAVTVVAASVLVLPNGEEPSSDASVRLPAPETVASPSGRPVPLDDDYVHLIVTPTGVPDGSSAPQEPGAVVPGPPDDASIGATDGESAWTIDGGTGQLVMVDGELMLLTADGELVPASGAAVAAPEPPVGEPVAEPVASLGHPTMDELARRDGVAHITPIGDGSFAVAVTDPAVLDDLPLDANEDVPLALFSEPYESYQWALENTGSNLRGVGGAPAQIEDADIDITTAWPGATGDGVVVAIIDSGVDFSHPDLAANRWINPDEVCGNGIDDDANGFVDDCHGWDFAYDDNTPWNSGAHAHGTHVAGIVAAERGNSVGIAGVAPDAQIMDLNVGIVTGGDPQISTSAIARAVRYAADNGADIINMSLGTSPGTPRSWMATLESAIVYAGERGALIVVAAGNDATNLDGGNTAWPASYDFPYMVTVAATAPNETLASFSNYGSVIDVAAPGHVILSTIPGSYGFMSGTSQASPVTAGVAALALDANPGLSAAQVRDLLRSTADRHDAYVGRVPDGVRVNAGNLIGGTTPDVGFDEVAVSVSGLAGAVDTEPVDASLDIVVPTDEYDEAFSWNATLIARESDGDYVVIGHEVQIDGTWSATDDAGAVDLALAGTGTVDLSLSLPQGRYALVLEPVADADPTQRLGDAFVAAFDVADGTAPVTTTTTPTSGPDPTPTPTTLAPTPTTLAPTPTTLPPTANPSPTTTAGPSPGPSPTPSPSPSPTTTQSPGPDPEPTPTTSAPVAAPTTTQAPPDQPTPPPTSTIAPPATTTPPTGSQPPTTTNPQDPTVTTPPVTAGDWSVSGVLPAQGPVDTMHLVRLNGTFPEAAYVWFGEQPGVVVATSPYTIDVLTPVRGSAGVVDIALVPPGSSAVLTVPSAYTFIDDTQAAPEPSPDTPTSSPTTTVSPSPDTPTSSPTTTASPSPSPSPAPTTTVSPSPTPSPTTTVSPSPAPPIPSPTTTLAPTPSPDPAPTTTVVTTLRRPRAALGDQVDLSSGVRGRRITGDSPVGSAALCSTDPCSLT
ncbi:MAG: S8 family peptidase [Actinomycetota bacterium]